MKPDFFRHHKFYTMISRALPFVVFAAAVLLFGTTMAPAIGPTDSGELTLAAAVWGVAHAPGFSFYTMIGALWCALFPGSPITAMNAFSVVSSAAAVALCSAGLLPPRAKAADNTPTDYVPALASIAIVALSPVFWPFALVAEVYGLSAALIAAAALVAWRGEPTPVRTSLTGVLTGTAAAVHPVSLVVFSPLIIARLFAPDVRDKLRHAVLATVATFASFGALSLAMMWRASTMPTLNWGAPATLDRLWRHLVAQQYQTNLGNVSPERLRELFAINGELLVASLGIIGLPLFVLGAVRLMRHNKAMFYGAILSIAACWLYASVYDIAQDREAYLIPAVVVFAFVAPMGVQQLGQLLSRQTLHTLVPALLAVSIAATAWWRWDTNDRSSEVLSQHYVENSLNATPPNAIVLTGEWQLFSPWLALHHLEQRWPSNLVIDLQLLRDRAWYVESLRHSHPALADSLGPDFETFHQQLVLFERNELSDVSIIAKAWGNVLARLASSTGRPVVVDGSAIGIMQAAGVQLPGPASPCGTGLLLQANLWTVPTTTEWNTTSLLDGNLIGPPEYSLIRTRHAESAFAFSNFYTATGDTLRARPWLALANQLQQAAQISNK